MHYRRVKEKDSSYFMEVKITDFSLLNHNLLNKGMGFTEKERDEFFLHGLIPPCIATIDDQRLRSYETFKKKSTALEKYIYLRDLQNSNETLFYNLLTFHIEEMMPIIYTPTVGDGCLLFSQIYRRPRGLFLSYPNRNLIDKILANSHFDDVKVIVVSDGERILGLGDQGAGGMGISIGKLSLYTACAGIHPSTTLPILLDTGTDNESLIQDPFYVGWRHKRIRGKEYDDFIDHFICAVKKRFPHILLQWEDFSKQNAEPLLERYQNSLCTFNDDIQGTAAVVLATIFAAEHLTKTKIDQEKIVIVGAGSAGCGIAELLFQAMKSENLSAEEAKSRIFLMDTRGLLTKDSLNLSAKQKAFAEKSSYPTGLSLEETIDQVQPTILIGVSGQKGVFTEKIIRKMAQLNKRPMIFPLSNPTSCAEAVPSDLLKWTNEKAIVGTGSPFPDIDQVNNAYIFPGVGLGVIASQATKVSDAMFLAAAKALADSSPIKENPEKSLLPPLTKLREVSFHVALLVAKEAVQSGLAPFKSSQELEQAIHDTMWQPQYIPYKKVDTFTI